MINEIFIDNFRCLTNFRIKPGDFQLWIGENGSGKTSVLDAIRSLQRLLRGEHVEDIFDGNSRTIWDKRLKQSFSLLMLIDDETFKYRLTIEHSPNEEKVRIKQEELIWKEQTFFSYDGQDAHLYRINRKTKQVEEGASFPADWSRSIIASIPQRDDNEPLLRFKKEIDSWLIINPNPVVVENQAKIESRTLSEHAENFAQWYRHVIQENPGIGYKARELLIDVLPGFEHLSLKEYGYSRRLTATFRIDGKDCDFDFLALSDGQRQLLILYSVLEALRAGIFSTVFIDEPDNFVSLREIQPWVDNLNEVSDDEGKQVIIVSHHPEIVNKMARGNELWFSRQEGGLTVTGSFPSVGELSPAEIMARGWENDE